MATAGTELETVSLCHHWHVDKMTRVSSSLFTFDAGDSWHPKDWEGTSRWETFAARIFQ